ncbi:hypothetical protein [uncultured Polaribacter sp.]|uniref:hypothetical protein n=1 Tax=uncultured Polaribacter sp. TaxID=174711 RepID=UPI0026106ECE|nr:hypothetical protein [uncultured Polaribacter sp.]
MHKKLENDLMSLAHSLLKMKNKDDVFALKEKAQEIYEKLALLAFVEEYVNTTPNLLATKPEVLQKVEEAVQIKEGTKSIETVAAPTIDKLEKEIEPSKENAEVIDKIEVQQEHLEQEIEQPFDALENIIFGDTKPTNFKDDAKDVGNIPTLEEELKDTIPVDVMANLFEPVKPKSLNDKLQQNINIGLNDRIAFVKHLFDGSQEDFNRVVSQLNTFKTGNEAKNFIHKMVKPDYDWKNQEDLENRFMNIIERKFA